MNDSVEFYLTQLRHKYLAVIETTPEGFTFTYPQFGIRVQHQDRTAGLEHLSRELARHFLQTGGLHKWFTGITDEHIFAETQQPLRDLEWEAEILAELPEGTETLEWAAAPLNFVSLQLHKLLLDANLTQTELAKRLEVSRSTVNEWLNPFYWGHSYSTLKRVAGVLGMEVKLDFRYIASGGSNAYHSINY